MKSFLFFILLTFNLYAQDSTLAVIPVGEAQSEKETILFLKPVVVTKNSLIVSQSNELVELLKNDFAFYKHRFDQQSADLKISLNQIDWSLFVTQNARFVVASSLEASGKMTKARVHLLNVPEKKILGEFVVDLSGSTLRSEGHRIADGIYRLISKKDSIFLSKIAFVSDRTSRGKEIRKEIYMMDFDGRRVERLTFADSTVISPAISPDNNKLIFSLIETKYSGPRKKMSKNIDLKMMDLRTKKISTISDRPGINSGAIFNSDGTKIYFTMSYGGNADIYEMELLTSRTRKLTTHSSEDVDPSINKDGSLMTFLSSRPGRAHVYTMDPAQAEKDVKRISFVGQFNASPRFSKDGKEIVFVSWVDKGFDLYRIDSFGNNLVRMTKNFGSNEEPSFSPDGEFVIFTSQRVLSRNSMTQDIYLMNRDGEIVGQLTENFGRCSTPRWTN